MRLEVLLLILLLLLGGLLYYKDGGLDTAVDVLTFKTLRTASSTDTSTISSLFSRLLGKTSLDTEEEVAPSTKKQSAAVYYANSPATAQDEEKVDIAGAQAETSSATRENEEEVPSDPRLQPVSPYSGTVSLSIGKAKEKNAEQEYLILTAKDTVSISGWKLESTMTRSEATIPKGIATLDDENDRDENTIVLHKGDVAYLTTGETPLRSSFKENQCSGYLSEFGSFYPSIRKSCPLPGDEMLQYGGISQTDDECFEFVESIKQCELISRDELLRSDLSSRCESFVRNVLTYEGCVNKHEDQIGFDSVGIWRIYLDKNGELWRSTNETIRLLDTKGKVVALLEY